MANGTSKFAWNQESVNSLVHDEANKTHVLRPFFPLFGKQGSYTTSIPGHRIKHLSPQNNEIYPLSIPINQCLTPIILSRDLIIFREQFDKPDTLNQVVREAAYRVSMAEDAVILLGPDAKELIRNLGVKADADQLAEQTPLLAKGAPPVSGPILESIIQGIEELERNWRFGRYAAIVSLDLWREAHKPYTEHALVAPIHEIEPLLIEKGFVYSSLLPRKTGVIFSLNGDAIKMAVPVDTSVELVEERESVILQVVKQIRLVVDIPEAVVALR